MPDPTVGLSGVSHEPNFLYFGCWGSRAGHYLHDDHGQSLHFDHKTGRWPVVNSAKLDGSFTPRSTREHGMAKLWHSAGWTILAFHDYSRDERPGSNAAFILRGDHTAEEVLAAARQSFGAQLEYIEKLGPINVVEKHADRPPPTPPEPPVGASGEHTPRGRSGASPR